jgi:pimeloyl-ACP methyl ester carboxylesterase
VNLELISREPSGSRRATPLLFVHGAWHGAWCWDEHFLPYFAKQGYSVHALSLRGHGKSEGRVRGSRIRDYVRDVAQAAATLPAPPVVIGHSMGGLVTQKYLERHAAPAAVLLASVPPAGVWRVTLKYLGRAPLAFAKANLTLSLAPLVADPGLVREAMFSAGMPAADVERYTRLLGDESYLAFLDMLVLDLPRPKRVRTPMLVLGGAGDSLFSPAEIEATARAYGTRAELVPGMAHDMMLDQGWQPVADRIIAWLRERGI